MPIVDYLIITPMDEEFKGVAASWPIELTEMAPIRGVTYYKALHHTNGREALVIITSMGSQGQANTGVFASEAIRIWSPANVVQIGIAGSLVGGDLPLGDVIVPGLVFGYDVGEVVELPTPSKHKSGSRKRTRGVDESAPIKYVFRHSSERAGRKTLGSARAYRLDEKGYSKWQRSAHKVLREEFRTMKLKNIPSRRPEVHIGSKVLLASGNFVVKSRTFARQLREEIRKELRAVEMEARALFEAVDFATEHAPTLVVRGISDYADPGKEETDRESGGAYRRASVRAAALFVAGLIDRKMRYFDASQSTTEPLRVSLEELSNALVHAKKYGLNHLGKNSLCVVFDRLLELKNGAPELTFSVRIRSAGDSAKLSLRHRLDDWTRFPQPKTVRNGVWTWEIPRTAGAAQFGLALIAEQPSLTLSIEVKDEFGRVSSCKDHHLGRS